MTSVACRAALVAAFGLVMLAWPSSSAAQLNAEKLRRDRELTAGFSGAVDGNFALRAGNVEFLELGGSFRLEHNTFRPETSTTTPPALHDTAFIVGALRFKDFAGTPIINNGFLHLRWTRLWLDRLGSELFTQFQFDEFLRIQKRALIGAGLRFVPFDSELFSFALGSGYMFEFEGLDLPDAATGDDQTFLHRWTSYASLRFRFAGGLLSLSNTVYAQPALSDFGDFRILDEGDLMFEVTERFALGWSWYLRFDSEPPAADVVRLDVVLQSTVRFRFQAG